MHPSSYNRLSQLLLAHAQLEMTGLLRVVFAVVFCVAIISNRGFVYSDFVLVTVFGGLVVVFVVVLVSLLLLLLFSVQLI